jgi:hypothetical protein
MPRNSPYVEETAAALGERLLRERGWRACVAYADGGDPLPVPAPGYVAARRIAVARRLQTGRPALAAYWLPERLGGGVRVIVPTSVSIDDARELIADRAASMIALGMEPNPPAKREAPDPRQIALL